jgi:hypothetical protein
MHVFLFPSNSASIQTNNTFSHSSLRQSIPETIYDYGGPSPHSSSSMTSDHNSSVLAALGEELGWTKSGWSIATLKDRLAKSGHRNQAASPAGFGWYKEERRVGQRVIGEGGMYI